MKQLDQIHVLAKQLGLSNLANHSVVPGAEGKGEAHQAGSDTGG